MFVYLCFTLPFPKFHLEMIKVSLCGDRSVTSGNASFFYIVSCIIIIQTSGSPLLSLEEDNQGYYRHFYEQ